MNAPAAKQRKRAAVQSLRTLARDVGMDMAGRSRAPDMSQQEFQTLQQDVLAKATQQEHTAPARQLLQEFVGEPMAQPMGAAGDGDTPMENVSETGPATDTAPKGPAGFRLQTSSCIFTYNSVNGRGRPPMDKKNATFDFFVLHRWLSSAVQFSMVRTGDASL